MSHKINQQEEHSSDSDVISYRSFPDARTSKSNSDSDNLPSTPSSPDIPEEKEEDDFDWNSSQVLASIPFTLRVNSATARVLICANALAFTVSDEVHPRVHVRSLQRPSVLPMILSIHAQWNEEFGADIQDILQLPMFTARFVVSADDTRISPLTIGNLEALLQHLHDSKSAALLSGPNDTLAVSTVPSSAIERVSVIVFTPQVPHSPEANQASIRFIPSIDEAATFIFMLFGPDSDLTTCILSRKPPPQSHHEILHPVLDSNLRLLDLSMQSRDKASDAITDQRTITNLQRNLAAEETKMQNSLASINQTLEQVEDLQAQLAQIQAFTDEILQQKSQEQAQYYPSIWADWDQASITSSKSKERSWLPKRSGSIGSTVSSLFRGSTQMFNSIKPSSSSSREADRDPPKPLSTTRMSKTVTPMDRSARVDRLPSYAFDAVATSPRRRSPPPITRPSPPLRRPPSPPPFDDVDAGYEAALRLQAQLTAEEDMSYQLAKQLEEEEMAQIAAFEALQRTEVIHQPFDCPICADTLPPSDLIVVDGCGHSICRGCVLAHVKAQITQALWPIFCPMCPNTVKKRGVISRWIAEIVGADDAVFDQWNRMETAGLAINVECPRCKKSAPIDAEDFQATKVMDCPLRCGAHWCKNCHREIPRGQLHSCDGEEEFKALIQAQSGLFKKCPKCGSMIEKNGGCDHMACHAPGCGHNFSWSTQGR